ncbi:hypothetical protein KCP76_08245 [Salmonella enterica subsp. enterica serovar Weltevreden]|nr:hypothetical protein KCP76_08245 [Salmonella enterica subsp. enterica serovar Weltevreden]
MEDTLPASLPLGIPPAFIAGGSVIHRPEMLILDEPTSGVDQSPGICSGNIVRSFASG